MLSSNDFLGINLIAWKFYNMLYDPICVSSDNIAAVHVYDETDATKIES